VPEMYKADSDNMVGFYKEVSMQEQAIEMLRQDMMGEHQAIVQYLLHAYAMGEIPLAFEVEAIARDEMRHLDWLADLITELGGEPTMERIPPDLAPGTVSEQMLKDVQAEQTAIDQYRAHMEAIEDPHVRLMLARIVHDEMAHKAQFTSFVEEAAGLPASESNGIPATEDGARLEDILNQGVRHEYTVTLQYLYHSFVAKDKDLAEEMQNVAINEMQHIGWLAEKLQGKGGKPDMNHVGLVLTSDPEKMLKADIAAERKVTQAYTQQLPEIKDPSVKRLVERIRDHEIYHDAQFGDLLEEVEAEEESAKAAPPCAEEKPAPKAPPPIPSVGSLIDQE
jgi:bacterioferritin